MSAARRTFPSARREHIAGATFLVMSAAFALAPVSGQSPDADASGDPAASAGPSAAPTAQPTLPPGGVAPLPARIVSGTCAEPGDQRIPLNGPIAGGERDTATDERPVYASISIVADALDAVVADGGALVVGGKVGDPEAAVACGDLDGPRQSDVALAIALEPSNESGYTGTAMLHEEDGEVRVTVVVVGPPPEMTPGGSPAPSASAGASPAGSPDTSPGSTMPITSPGTSGAPTTPSPAPDEPGASGAVQTAIPNALTSPVAPPTVEPGTSGAPPFSPLPQASAPLPAG